VKAAKTDPTSKPLSPVIQRPKKGGTLANLLDRHTSVGVLWKLEDGRVRCIACGHRCLIAPGRRGICKVRFVYAGNAPGRVGEWENTRCPGGGETLIARCGCLIQEYKITSHGTCPRCGGVIPGLWPTDGAAGKPASSSART
jgi:hypothetical protein